LNLAAGTKEKSETEKVDRGGRLTLVSRSQNGDAGKRLFRIGICENVFANRENKLADPPEVTGRTRSEGDRSTGTTAELPMIVVGSALLGLVLGYFAGKKDR
jgi:hypothetical protein